MMDPGGIDILKEFLFPEVCCLCGEVSGYFSHKPVKILFGENEIESPYCSSCTRSLMKGYDEDRKHSSSADFDSVILFDYTHEAVRKAIFHIKMSKCKKCVKFFSELVGSIADESDIRNITYIPRSQKLLRKYGFDQSERIISTFVRCSDTFECIHLFERDKRHSKPQKTLSAKNRFINAQKSLKLREKAVVPKEIIVFDDVFTTGATAETAAKLLKDSGAEKIEMLFLAGAKIIIEERRNENE